MTEKVLQLRKMGMNFYDDPRTGNSDVGNYRVRTEGKSIITKDGREMFLEFTMGYRYSGITGKKVKIVEELALVIDTQYTGAYRKDFYGLPVYGELRDNKLEQQLWDMHLQYTIADILKAVNYISKDTYTKIEFI